MKTNKKQMALTTAICLLPMLAGLALYSRLPEQMPVHFALDGTPNGWTDRPWAVFGIPCFMAAINLTLHIALDADQKRANMSAALKSVSLWLIPVLSAVCYGLTIGAALGYPTHIEIIVPALVGALFVLAGNYLPKTKQSYTMGIRLPWTLHSAENWNRTHRLAGFLWVLGGLILLGCALLRLWSAWVLPVLLVIMVLLPTGYSYALYRKGI